MADEMGCLLHECVFTGDMRQLSALLRVHPADTRDKHGELLPAYQLRGIVTKISQVLRYVTVGGLCQSVFPSIFF